VERPRSGDCLANRGGTASVRQGQDRHGIPGGRDIRARKSCSPEKNSQAGWEQQRSRTPLGDVVAVDYLEMGWPTRPRDLWPANDKLRKTYDFVLPRWEKSLMLCLEEIAQIYCKQSSTELG
jgi:hypothetical protein